MSHDEPLIRWQWIGDHAGELADYTGIHLRLGLLPVLFGLIISVPLGILCHRYRWLYPPVLTVANILYSIPSLALFMIFVRYTGLTERTVMIPLTIYTLSVLVPNVVDGLASVPEPVRLAATAMGFGAIRRVVQVELPIAVPVVIAGVRVAAVRGGRVGWRVAAVAVAVRALGRRGHRHAPTVATAGRTRPDRGAYPADTRPSG
jgi:osmoprotectant transport system permease protein